MIRYRKADGLCGAFSGDRAVAGDSAVAGGHADAKKDCTLDKTNNADGVLWSRYTKHLMSAVMSAVVWVLK